MVEVLENSAPHARDISGIEQSDWPARAGFPVSVIRQLRPGEILFAEGEAAAYCFEVLNGVLKEYQMLEDGRREISDFYRKGDLLGYYAVPVRLETVEAVTNVAVRCIPRDVFYSRMDRSPAFSRAIVETLIERLARAQRRMLLLGRMNAHQRVASFLLRLAARANSENYAIEMSRQDIADHLGLTTETVCRVLTDFKKRKLVVMPSARRFSIIDRRSMESEADIRPAMN